MKANAVLACCAVAVLASGAVYDASTGYVTVKTAGSTASDSPLDGGKSNDSQGGFFWSDNLAIHAGTNYYIANWLRSPSATALGKKPYDCPADKVVLKGTINWKTFDPSIYNFANEGLFVLPGSIVYINDASTTPFRIGGLITLDGTTSSSPFTFKPYGTDKNYPAHQTFVCEAKIKTMASTDQLRVPSSGTLLRYGTMKLVGDMDEFTGWVNVSSNRVVMGSTGLANGVLSLNNGAELAIEAAEGATVPFGRVDVNTDSRLEVPVSNIVSVSELRIVTRTRLTVGCDPAVPTNGCVVLTRAPTFSAATDKIEIALSAPKVDSFTNTPAPFVVLRAPAGTLDCARFELVQDIDALANLPRPDGLVVETVGDEDVVSVTWKQVVRQVVPIPSAASANLFPEATTWSNGMTPDDNAGKDFLSTISCYFPYKGADWTFPGDSLTVSGSTLTFQYAKNTTINRFNIVNNQTLRAWPSGSNVINAETWLYGSGTVTFTFGNKTDLEWTRPIHGALNWSLNSRAYLSDKNDTASNYFYPSADNGDFAGTWLLKTDPPTTTDENFHYSTFAMTLCLKHQHNLGGPLPAFAYNALTLQQWAAIQTKAASVVLDDVTRGVNVVGRGQLLVGDGQSLEVSVPLTLEGFVRKAGAGTLRLGGTVSPRFYGKSQLAPADLASAGRVDTNVLWIAEGALKPGTKQGADGLDIRFSPDARLLLDLVPTGDAATYGLYDVAWATPLAVLAASDDPDVPGAVQATGKIPVAFDLGETSLSRNGVYEVPICTVPAGQLGVSSFVFDSPAKGFAVKVSAKTIDPGTVTYVAQVAYGGMMVLVR